jgi:hypothetical protein
MHAWTAHAVKTDGPYRYRRRLAGHHVLDEAVQVLVLMPAVDEVAVRRSRGNQVEVREVNPAVVDHDAGAVYA